MGSNNYVEVITDPIESREVVADFKRLCASARTTEPRLTSTPAE
jgi:hypothetical protein